MSSIWKKWFIPHEDNGYKPHSLRGSTVLTILIIALLLYGASFIYPSVLERTNFTATILPSVLVDLTNGERNIYGASSLRLDTLLIESAQLKANDMAAKGYFSHTSPEGLSPWYWLTRVSYGFSYAGENLAVNFTDSEEVTNAWMNSPGHRANILNSKFTEIGIATAKGKYDGREAIFVVQHFGTPVGEGVRVGLPKTEAKVISEPREITKKEVKGEAGGEELYIEVQNLGDQPLTQLSSSNQAASQQYASKLEEFLATPRTALFYIYVAIIIIVSISLLLNIFVEIRRQHSRHIFYGITLLLMLFLLVFANKSAFLSPLLIR